MSGFTLLKFVCEEEVLCGGTSGQSKEKKLSQNVQ